MRRRSSRGAIIAICILGVLIFSGVFFAYNTITDIFQPAAAAGAGKLISITISPGETTAKLADDLQTAGLIRNALAFRIWARIKGLDTQLQEGEYDHLSSSMTISDIIDELLTTPPDKPYVSITVYVSIPEGWRIEQIAAQFAAAGLAKFNAKDFLNYTKHPNLFPDAGKYPLLKDIPPGDSMEGLLFPAKYDIPLDADARYVVNRLLTTMQSNIQQYHLDTKAKANGLNVYQMVILASIVQREIASYKDAQGVAGVYLNRFQNIIPNDTAGFLDADPTVQYARDSQSIPKQYWAALQDAAKNIDPGSPWNTYTNKGFPPTPICSPSLASLEAAASPLKSDYFYFLNKKKDGSIVYAKTYAEFQLDEQKYL